MCGIFFSISSSNSILPSEECSCSLQKRGPDSVQVQVRTVQNNKNNDTAESDTLHLTFLSTVLSLRGDHVYPQPLVDKESQSVLCWNGEAWKIAGEKVQGEGGCINDTELIFGLFLQAVKNPSSSSSSHHSPVTATGDCYKNSAIERFSEAVSSISGPFSFVFHDAVNSILFFGRDCLGRRSLLQGLDHSGNLKICSIDDGDDDFQEVDTDGLHLIDLDHAFRQNGNASASASASASVDNNNTSSFYNVITVPWTSNSSASEISTPAHLVRLSFSNSFKISTKIANLTVCLLADK